MEDFKKWIKSAGIRAIKTFAQTMASLITVGVAINEIDWKNVISVAIVAMVYSLLTSMGGLPELKAPESDGEIIFRADGQASIVAENLPADATQVILDIVQSSKIVRTEYEEDE